MIRCLHFFGYAHSHLLTRLLGVLKDIFQRNWLANVSTHQQKWDTGNEIFKYPPHNMSALIIYHLSMDAVFHRCCSLTNSQDFTGRWIY